MHTLNMHTFNSNGLESLYMNLKIMDFCILYRVKKKKYRYMKDSSIHLTQTKFDQV